MGTLFDVHPLEVLQQIVRHLDPVSLIALSQTSRPWRALIRPIRHDFVRRLLALELLPDHGGLVPLFDENAQTLTPPWDADEWRTVKFACGGCNRLLTHMMFDNHAILRRPYRKPPPGSAEAERAVITDWEPLEPRARWRCIQVRAAQDEKEWRELARAAARNPPAPPIHPFALVPQADEDAIRLSEVVKPLIGAARQKRRCIECKRRHGNWSRKPYPHRGTQDVPVVISRQLRFRSTWERYFPGLFVAPESRPRYWRSMLDSRDNLPFALHVVRCPSCGIWQELGAFRQWTPYYSAFGSGADPASHPVAGLLCNPCHLKTHRDPALLARDLSAGALEILRTHRNEMLYCLKFGWRLIDRDFSNHNESKAVRDQVIEGLTWTSDSRDGIVVQDSDLPDLRRRLHRYREFIYNEVGPDTRAQVLQSWFRLWVEDYDLIEAMYCWLNQQIARLELEPNLVLDYVMEHNPYRI